jgi:DNA ligase (NAD+)
VVPIANLEPVDVAGVTIERASLHNTSHVAHLDLREGDTVIVERRGDVIPQVTTVLKAKRPKGIPRWEPPNNCPACGSKLVFRDKVGKVDAILPEVPLHMCMNSKCAERILQRLQQFVAKCVKGMGKESVKLFVAKGLLTGPADLYSLHTKCDQVCPYKACRSIAAGLLSKGSKLGSAQR